MDGKHIEITKPINTGSVYFNYKGFFSIVLLAIVDAELNFIYTDVGTNGRISDGGVRDKCSFKQVLETDELAIPKYAALPNTRLQVPYVIIADDAFPLKRNLLKPYPGKQVPKERRIFNYRLSRARRVSDNAFGILAARFRIFHSQIILEPEKVKMIVLASCALHNFLRQKNQGIYKPPQSLDRENTHDMKIERGDWRSTTTPLVELQKKSMRPSQLAKEVQCRFAVYFNGVGAVPWQDRMCDLH